MRSGIRLAIGGKGGVGKTTLCAVWAHLFAKDGFDVLAIDADPNVNLALALGVSLDQCPQPLISMKKLIAERTGTGRDSLGAYFKMNPKVSDLPDEYSLKHDGMKLLVLGGITQGGGGCACPEGAFLKALLTHSILQRKELVLVDLAAGVEFFGRASIQGIDALVIVVEPGSRSIETALNIKNMAIELGIKKVAAVVNKITDTEQIEKVKSQLGDLPVLANIRHLPAIQQADMNQNAAYSSCPELVEKLTAAKESLLQLIEL